MIFGIRWGRDSIRLELGDGRSERWIASADASSMRRMRRVKTLRTRKATMMQLTSMKMKTPRRILRKRRFGRAKLREDRKSKRACPISGRGWPD